MCVCVCEMCMCACVCVCNTSESFDSAVGPEGVHREAAAMIVRLRQASRFDDRNRWRTLHRAIITTLK